MLVIARREGESVAVDGPAVVTVRKLSCGRVLLGIEAEPTVTILRGRPDNLTEPAEKAYDSHQQRE